MIAQVVLSLLLCGVLVYASTESRRSPVVALMTVVVAVAGLHFVWFPEHSTAIAAMSGIGRGADLVLYVWLCLSLIVLLNLDLKLRSQMELITRLARATALAAADPALTLAAAPAKPPNAASVRPPGRTRTEPARSRTPRRSRRAYGDLAGEPEPGPAPDRRA